MQNKINHYTIAAGLHWVAIPPAGLTICCGCPADTVKHLKKAGLIRRSTENHHLTESGPNAILLSDATLQNGQLCNLTEFPIMQMLYMQGMGMPGHPNNTGKRPMLIGLHEHIESQSRYLFRGNYGLSDKNEILACGVGQHLADKLYDIKRYFAYGHFLKPNELIDARPVGEGKTEIQNGVSIERVAFNVFRIAYEGESVQVDLNLPDQERILPPYALRHVQIPRTELAIVHSGEGNGWDVRRPCMSSVIVHRHRIFLVDAGPNTLSNLEKLGISRAEVDGVFLTHIHDDHFAGLCDLIHGNRKLYIFASSLVCATALKKLSVLFNMPEEVFKRFFNFSELRLNRWNNLDGLRVMPLLSPHPVETNMLFFEARHDGNTYSYAHLADTISFDALQKLTAHPDNEALSEADFEEIKNRYLKPAQVKKVDVGGGAIHGLEQDYSADKSNKLVWAHNDSADADVREVVCFGDVDVLASSDPQLHFKRNGVAFLKKYFPIIPDADLSRLCDPLRLYHFEPNSTLDSSFLHGSLWLVVAGSVYQEDQKQTFDAGFIIGFTEKCIPGRAALSYTSVSHVHVFQLDEQQVDELLQHESSASNLSHFAETFEFCLHSPLLSGLLPLHALYNLPFKIYFKILRDDCFYHDDELTDLHILLEGEASRYCGSQCIENLSKYAHIGGSAVCSSRHHEDLGTCVRGKFLVVKEEDLLRMPGVLWRLKEEAERRDIAMRMATCASKHAQSGRALGGLQKSEIFKNLTPQAIAQIAGKAHHQQYVPREVIVTEGEPSDRLFIILNGIVEVKKEISDGPDLIYAYLMSGNSFGEVGILENKPRSATVAALSDVEVLYFEHHDFMEIMHDHPDVAIDLAKLLGHYLVETNKRLMRGNKDRNLVVLVDPEGSAGGRQLARMVALRLRTYTDLTTVYAEFPECTISAHLHVKATEREVFLHANGMALMMNAARWQRPEKVKMAVLIDHLMNEYENIVLYYNGHLSDNLKDIVDSAHQIILVSDAKAEHWLRTLKDEKIIKNTLNDHQTRLFTVAIDAADAATPTWQGRLPDFNIRPDDHFLNEASCFYDTVVPCFQEAVDAFVDRLQRNNHLGIFIPTTQNVNEAMDTTAYIDRVLTFLGERFGGATSEEARGIWNSEELGLVGEKMYKVHTYASSNDLKKFLDETVEFVKKLKIELGQEAMAIEINQKLTLL
jgi:hemerythrin